MHKILVALFATACVATGALAADANKDAKKADAQPVPANAAPAAAPAAPKANANANANANTNANTNVKKEVKKEEAKK